MRELKKKRFEKREGRMMIRSGRCLDIFIFFYFLILFCFFFLFNFIFLISFSFRMYREKSRVLVQNLPPMLLLVVVTVCSEWEESRSSIRSNIRISLAVVFD